MISYPDYVDKIITRLESKGFEAFLVGGGLRDMLLGRAPNDFDVTTSATPEEMLSVFCDMRTIPTGLKHGTLTVLSGGQAVEVTTYRIDGEYSDSRHPNSVSFTKNICDDLARRDFTVNAMAYNKKRGLQDPFGGERDLKDKILRAVGDPKTRMKEDALRIMRALRFEAQLGFEIEGSTEAALCSCRDGLRAVSGERRGIELAKLVTAPCPASSLRRMARLGIGEYILGDHTPSDSLVSILPQTEASTSLRLGTLLSECDEDRAKKILRDLKYSNTLIDGALRIAKGINAPLPRTDADVRRFIIELGRYAMSVAKIRALLGETDISDAVSSVNSKNFCHSISELAIGGRELIELGISGKDVGNTLESLFNAVCQDPSKNNYDDLMSLVRNSNFDLSNGGET